jgi:nucleotide-binding universal stress UspA family protein
MTTHNLQNVVVAYTASSGGIDVLERAVALACRAPFHVLHVVTVIDPHVGSPIVPVRSKIDYRYAEEVQAAVAELVKSALVAYAAPHEVHFFVHARIGKPAEEILYLASEIGADLIMVGTHDHTTLERMLLGSTAARVVREAGCPVIVVRPKSYRSVDLLDVVRDDHPHRPYAPPHRYSYHEDRVITRPPDWPLY